MFPCMFAAYYTTLSRLILQCCSRVCSNIHRIASSYSPGAATYHHLHVDIAIGCSWALQVTFEFSNSPVRSDRFLFFLRQFSPILPNPFQTIIVRVSEFSFHSPSPPGLRRPVTVAACTHVVIITVEEFMQSLPRILYA